MFPAMLMIPVDAPDVAVQWYQKAFPGAQRTSLPEHGVELLETGGITLELVPGDAKLAAEPAGTVLYWQVSELEPEIDRFKKLGAVLHRGPLAIENNQGMCQMLSPFGSLIGLRGQWQHNDN